MAKKISLISLYCVLGLLVVAFVVGACVNVSYKPQIQSPFKYFVMSSDNSATYLQCSINDNTERYNELTKELNKAFNESVVSSIFSGRSGNKSRIELVGTTAPSFTSYKLKLDFLTESAIKLNGKNYTHPSNSAQELKYTEVYFDVVDAKGMQQNVMYYAVPVVKISGEEIIEYYKQTFYSNFDNLYKMINEAI